jgi:hypothetical protein
MSRRLSRQNASIEIAHNSTHTSGVMKSTTAIMVVTATSTTLNAKER